MRRGDNEQPQGYFAVAKIGHDGEIQDATTPFRDVRHSETCSLWDKDHLDNSTAREHIIQVLQQLKQDLQPTETCTSDDGEVAGSRLDPNVQEIMYAYYPSGGYYRRHVDAEAATRSTFRKFSFLLYLSPGWEGQ